MSLHGLHAFFTGAGHIQRVLRHFRRAALIDAVHRHKPGAHVQQPVNEKLLAASGCSIKALLTELGSGPNGLTEAQANSQRNTTGMNDVDYEHRPGWWLVLWHCYFNPFNSLLSVLVFISWLTGDHAAAIVIGTMVLLSTFLRFWQEGKSGKAADALRAMVSTTTTVVRPNDAAGPAITANNEQSALPGQPEALTQELPIKWLVPGDVIRLAAGDMIPADCRLMASKNLFVSQSALTGESLPLEKSAMEPLTQAQSPLELPNIIFMGTNVVSGSANALVVTTGRHTYFGALSNHVMASRRDMTSFEKSMAQVSWLLVRFTAVMTLLVFLVNGLGKGDWPLALLFSLSVAVGLTPEMLPMIVTSTLAKGAVFLSRKQVIVKRLDAIHGLGAMDVLCTDKTGTLTQDKVVLSEHVDAWGHDSTQVLHSAYLNSFYQTGLKNLLDVAVLEQADVHRQLDPLRRFTLVDEIPFDFNRRRMSVIVADPAGQHVIITKGAVEQVLSACSAVQRNADSIPLSGSVLAQVSEVAASFNRRGLRVVAVATKHVLQHHNGYAVADESNMCLLGYMVFLDPPKESALPALQALAHDGVTVKVLTGDNELVTLMVCEQVGLPVHGVLLGPELDAMSDAVLGSAAESHTVFARLTPSHKERIVRLLRTQGHVVGYLGDGLNDAAALRAADVGISVDTAVDIAKEAADIVLLEKSLMVLEQGVLEGRRTFANMLKYIRMAASSNFGNVFSVLIASALIPFLPMLPLHLLVQNLLYDISQIAIPFDNVDEASLRQPANWQPNDVARFMVFFGPVSSLFDMMVFALLWFVYGADSLHKQQLFQSGWFVAGLFTQTLVVHLIRTPGIPFIDSRASTPLIMTTLMVIGVAVFLPMGFMAPYFQLQALPLSYFAVLVGIVFLYAVMVQAMKGVYARRYGRGTWR